MVISPFLCYTGELNQEILMRPPLHRIVLGRPRKCEPMPMHFYFFFVTTRNMAEPQNQTCPSDAASTECHVPLLFPVKKRIMQLRLFARLMKMITAPWLNYGREAPQVELSFFSLLTRFHLCTRGAESPACVVLTFKDVARLGA